MYNIHVLENNMINKIAAGEVVERPASVVKELVENAIDAGATSIIIEINDGGASMIKIIDNGGGIPKEQVKTAFLRHATSKIDNLEDLENVMSLGFRGEALSSIVAVAQVEMVTKTSDDMTGLKIEINGGEVIEQRETGANTGTTITVRNLFFNTPARLKFMKKPSTESGYIFDMVNRFAIGNPEISFRYINNGAQALYTKGSGELKTAILQVYGTDVAKNIVDINFSNDYLSLNGFIGKPSIARGNRGYEHLYINGRYIKSELIQSAIEQAYKTLLFSGKFPFFVINMGIKPNCVDVNVHPTKLEVRFSEEDTIFNLVYDAIAKALEGQNLIPVVDLGLKPKFSQVADVEVYGQINDQSISFDQTYTDTATNIADANLGLDFNATNESQRDISSNDNDQRIFLNEPNAWEIPNTPPMDGFLGSGEYIPPKYAKNNETAHQNVATGKKDSSTVKQEKKNLPLEDIDSVLTYEDKEGRFFKDFRIVGQLFNTYWIIEQKDSMYLIDQHAAHERLIYEGIVENLKGRSTQSQCLIQHIILPLSPSETTIVVDNQELLQRLGFELEKYDDMVYALTAVPYVVKSYATASFFMDIIDKLSSVITATGVDVHETKISTIAQTACKAAVKANDRLNYVEAKELIEKMMKIKNPFTCPHGRPTIIEVSKRDIEKNFFRVM